MSKVKTRSAGSWWQPERYSWNSGEDLWREPVEVKNCLTYLQPEDGV
jgi:hypothetical protein